MKLQHGPGRPLFRAVLLTDNAVLVGVTHEAICGMIAADGCNAVPTGLHTTDPPIPAIIKEAQWIAIYLRVCFLLRQ